MIALPRRARPRSRASRPRAHRRSARRGGRDSARRSRRAPAGSARRARRRRRGGALEEQRARQPARAGADLDHRAPVERPAARAMRRVRLRSRMKFWPRLFLAAEPEARAITSRSGGRPSGLAPARARALVRRSCRAPVAARAARDRGGELQGFDEALRARRAPRAAMSNAVPWSGEVRTNGSPSVTLTPSSKASVLNGISAWS